MPEISQEQFELFKRHQEDLEVKEAKRIQRENLMACRKIARKEFLKVAKDEIEARAQAILKEMGAA